MSDPDDDPTKETYVDRQCVSCRWWDSSVQLANTQPDTTGACRKNPPVADDRSGSARWPLTDQHDWCSEWSASPVEENSGEQLTPELVERALRSYGISGYVIHELQQETGLYGEYHNDVLTRFAKHVAAFLNNERLNIQQVPSTWLHFESKWVTPNNFYVTLKNDGTWNVSKDHPAHGSNYPTLAEAIAAVGAQP